MDPFATLGMPREYALDSEELERKYRDLQRALHPDRHVNATPAERRVALSKAVEVNEAYRVLKDDVRRAESLLALLGSGGKGASKETAVDPELLMEVMELRESLSEAKQDKDLPRVQKLASQVHALATTTRRELAAALEGLPTGAGLAKPASLLSKLKYYKRFLDEVIVIEDDALTWTKAG
jgi:molecular chaperone HscB